MYDLGERPAATRRPFGEWLVEQAKRDDFIGRLAKGAATARDFPRTGDIEAVRKWLQSQRASGDDWEALDDAELNYAAW